MSGGQSERGEDRTDGGSESTSDGELPVDINKLADLRQARKDRIERIRAEIENGTYDSDELLNAALERMVGRLPIERSAEDDEEDSN